MNKLLKRCLIILCLLFAAYLGSYTVFRQTHVETWDADKREYVIFPENKILYYLFRPIAVIDGNLTGMRFHIGPH